MDKLRFCVVWISTDAQMSVERPTVLTNLTMVMDEIALAENKNKMIHQHIFNHVQQVQRMNGGSLLSSSGEHKHGGGGSSGSSSSSSASWSLSGLTKTIGSVVAKAKEWIPRAAPDTKITQVTSKCWLCFNWLKRVGVHKWSIVTMSIVLVYSGVLVLLVCGLIFFSCFLLLSFFFFYFFVQALLC